MKMTNSLSFSWYCFWFGTNISQNLHTHIQGYMASFHLSIYGIFAVLQCYKYLNINAIIIKQRCHELATLFGSYFQYRSYEIFDDSQFKKDLTQVPFHVAEIFDDIHDSFDFTKKLIGDVVNEHAPLKTGLRRYNHAPLCKVSYAKLSLWKTCYDGDIPRIETLPIGRTIGDNKKILFKTWEVKQFIRISMRTVKMLLIRNSGMLSKRLCHLVLRIKMLEYVYLRIIASSSMTTKHAIFSMLILLHYVMMLVELTVSRLTNQLMT